MIKVHKIITTKILHKIQFNMKNFSPPGILGLPNIVWLISYA